MRNCFWKDSTNFRHSKMTLKLRILRSLTRLFIILVSLTRSLFSEKLLISNRCISGLMSNLIKKSWTVSNISATYSQFGIHMTLQDGYLEFRSGNSWKFTVICFLQLEKKRSIIRNMDYRNDLLDNNLNLRFLLNNVCHFLR